METTNTKTTPFVGNPYTRHGLKYEQTAMDWKDYWESIKNNEAFREPDDDADDTEDVATDHATPDIIVNVNSFDFLSFKGQTEVSALPLRDSSDDSYNEVSYDDGTSSSGASPPTDNKLAEFVGTSERAYTWLNPSFQTEQKGIEETERVYLWLNSPADLSKLSTIGIENSSVVNAGDPRGVKVIATVPAKLFPSLRKMDYEFIRSYEDPTESSAVRQITF